MRFVAIFIVFCLCLASAKAASPSKPDMRLVQTGPSRDTRRWVTQEELEAMIVDPNVRFADVTEDPEPLPRAEPPTYTFPSQPMHKELVASYSGFLDSSMIADNLQTLSSFFTRYYTSDTGFAAARWVHDTADSYIGSRSDMTVEYFENSFLQPSVIVTLQGSVSNASVVLGAHLDSVGATVTSEAPGVDDDGSGTATLLEVVRVVAQHGIKTQNTIKFCFFAAEEAGLLGSKAIANAWAKDHAVVVAMIQFDCTGFDQLSAVPTVGIVTDFTSAPLNAWIRIAVDSYTDIIWTDTKCGYACSDHASFSAVGYSAAFPFEATFEDRNPYMHSTKDNMANINMAHLMEFANLALANLIELSFLSPSNAPSPPPMMTFQ